MGQSESESQSESAPPTPAVAADPALCDRVAACADAFAALAPAELAGPARLAAEQLDHSLIESPARAAACAGALASFRADLERLAIDVPAACQTSASTQAPEPTAL